MVIVLNQKDNFLENCNNVVWDYDRPLLIFNCMLSILTKNSSLRSERHNFFYSFCHIECNDHFKHFGISPSFFQTFWKQAMETTF